MALKGALDNPKLLMEAIQGIHHNVGPKSDPSTQSPAALKGIRNEEARILEAYRLNILTPEQLARELELLAARREVIEKQRRECSTPSQIDQSVRLSVQEYCDEVRRRLADLTFETKRKVLRLLVRRIVFEGERVRISGIIPLSSLGGIATTGVEPYGRNNAERLIANFTLVTPVIRDLTASRAASRANLLKASAARWPPRSDTEQTPDHER
jgi:hypothetical protein